MVGLSGNYGLLQVFLFENNEKALRHFSLTSLTKSRLSNYVQHLDLNYFIYKTTRPTVRCPRIQTLLKWLCQNFRKIEQYLEVPQSDQSFRGFGGGWFKFSACPDCIYAIFTCDQWSLSVFHACNGWVWTILSRKL